jgi:hypothetical protein
MADYLTPKQSQQMVAIKYLADWCKWLVALETAAIGAMFAMAHFLDKAPGIGKHITLTLLFLGVIAFLASMYFAAYIMYGLPEIIEQLTESQADSINNMKSSYLSYDLLTVQRALHNTLILGLLFLVLALLAMLFI